jgi:hypothetical protein
MKRTISIGLVLLTCAVGTISWGVCPEDTLDRGECDTMYVEPWSADTVLEGDPPYLVRVPIFVTNDLADVWDSISAFVIPLCYNHSNPSKYCSLSTYWNMHGALYLLPWFSTRSIFRHIVEGTDTLHHNRMADMAGDFSFRDWDVANIQLDGTSHFRLSMIATGTSDQLWWEGSRVLLATLTFKLEDTMEVCIDTCFWPPVSHLEWVVYPVGGGNIVTKVPRLGNSHDPESYEICFRAISTNPPPNAFALLFPPNDAFTPRKIPLDWETTTDPDPGDEVKYDLYLSTSADFSPDSTTVDSNLTESAHLKTLDYGTYYWKVKAKDGRGAERLSNETWRFMVTGLPQLTVGDFNSDGAIDVGDVVFAVNYLYKLGIAPDPMEAGDVNCDGVVDIGDVVYLVNYLFKGGLPPCEP